MSSTPKTRREFWENKFAANVARDHRNSAALEAAGWRVEIVWECETYDPKPLEDKLAQSLRMALNRPRKYRAFNRVHIRRL